MGSCTHFIGNEEEEIGADVSREFEIWAESDLPKVAPTLPVDRLRRLLRDDKTSPRDLGLCALLLGHCGKGEDAAMMRKLVEQLVKSDKRPRFDKVLLGYVLLAPKEGWSYACELLKDPATDFNLRYTVIRAAKYLRDERPKQLSEDELCRGVALALDHPDLADFSIEYLRKSKYWKFSKQIFALSEKKEFNVAIMRRAILRYALQCPDPQAAAFVEAARRNDPERMAEMEENLKGELVPEG